MGFILFCKKKIDCTFHLWLKCACMKTKQNKIKDEMEIKNKSMPPGKGYSLDLNDK